MKLLKKIWAKYKELLQGKGCLVTGILVIIPLLFLCCFSTFGFFAVDTGLRSAGVLPTYTPTVPATDTPLPTHTPSPTNIPAPTDTPTLTPTYTSTPHPTDTASPTPEPSPTEQPPTDTPTPAPTATPTEVPDTGEAEVHVVDVGQGDAILIRGPGGETVLIDGGGSGSGIVQYLRAQGVERLDLVVATHPHADHIGGLVDVLQAMPVEEVVTNGVPHTTLTYERFLDAIAAAGAIYTEAERGDTLQVGSLLFDVVHPPAGFRGSLNDQSIVLDLTHGDVGFLFAGDAEVDAESSMLASGQNLSATVLKVGHHGSRTSSSPRFLEQVQPEVAMYSCGRDNRYGHPHAETLANLANVGAEIYGTDVNGTVVVTSDGRSYQVELSQDAAPRAPPVDEPAPTDTPVPEPDPEPDPPPVTACVDINSAPRDDLMRIIHIGEVRADELISLRPFSSVDEMTRIHGIGPSRLADIKEQGLACVP